MYKDKKEFEPLIHTPRPIPRPKRRYNKFSDGGTIIDIPHPKEMPDHHKVPTIVNPKLGG